MLMKSDVWNCYRIFCVRLTFLDEAKIHLFQKKIKTNFFYLNNKLCGQTVLTQYH